MRSWSTAIIVALTCVSGLQAVDYAQRADRASFLRMTSAERPPCCANASKTRFTLPGGDCCKHLVWQDAELTSTSTPSMAVPPAMTTPSAVVIIVAWSELEREWTPSRARGPPRALFYDTDVLLI